MKTTMENMLKVHVDWDKTRKPRSSRKGKTTYRRKPRLPRKKKMVMTPPKMLEKMRNAHEGGDPTRRTPRTTPRRRRKPRLSQKDRDQWIQALPQKDVHQTWIRTLEVTTRVLNTLLAVVLLTPMHWKFSRNCLVRN